MARIVLIDPKYPHNIGAAIRAASCYGIEEVVWSGERSKALIEASKRIPREERMKGYKEVKLTWNAKPLEDSHPSRNICIELLQGSIPLPFFTHQPDMTYVFGPEDGSVPAGIRRLCSQFVVIPSHHCLNLSAAVYVVLYDRAVKMHNDRDIPLPTLLETRGDIRFYLEE